MEEKCSCEDCKQKDAEIKELAEQNEMVSDEYSKLYLENQKLKKKIKLIRERFEHWDVTRGGYILSQKRRDELKEFIFTGKSKTMYNFDKYKKDLEKEKKQESEKTCNQCEHIESCVVELYLKDNMPDKFVCDNFKLKQEKENE